MRFLVWSLLSFFVFFIAMGVCSVFGFFHLGDGGWLPAALAAPVMGFIVSYYKKEEEEEEDEDEPPACPTCDHVGGHSYTCDSKP